MRCWSPSTGVSSGLGTQQPGAPTLRGHAASQLRRSKGASTNHLRGRFGTVCLGTSVGAQLVKNPPAKRETWVRSLSGEDPRGGGKGYPLQESGLGNSMDYAVYGVAESTTSGRLSHTRLGTTCPGRNDLRPDSTGRPGSESQGRGRLSPSQGAAGLRFRPE